MCCLFLTGWLIACQSSTEKSAGSMADCTADRIYYAKGFRMETHSGYRLVRLMNPWKPDHVLATYVLCPKSEHLPSGLPSGILIRTPLEKTVVFSSVTAGLFQELDVLSTLVGIAEPQYIPIPYLNEQIAKGKIQNVGQAAHPDMETLMVLEPEAIFTNPLNDSGINGLHKVNASIINCFEYMETHPLGQAEWIRFVGLFFDKEKVADSLFFETEKKYNEWTALTAHVPVRPTVFTELKQGDFWYMPGGQSYMAHLFDDAGAEYVLKNDEHSGSLSFPFETILDKAENADYWLFKYYSPQAMTYSRLRNDYANYAFFRAYKDRKIYACNTLQSGAYYLELPIHPDRILKDLIGIFHPDLLSGYTTVYYRPLED